MIDTYNDMGATLVHSDGRRGADVVRVMSATHPDGAPVADNGDRESMSKDGEECA